MTEHNILLQEKEMRARHTLLALLRGQDSVQGLGATYLRYSDASLFYLGLYEWNTVAVQCLLDLWD